MNTDKRYSQKVPVHLNIFNIIIFFSRWVQKKSFSIAQHLMAAAPLFLSYPITLQFPLSPSSLSLYFPPPPRIKRLNPLRNDSHVPSSSMESNLFSREGQNLTQSWITRAFMIYVLLEKGERRDIFYVQLSFCHSKTFFFLATHTFWFAFFHSNLLLNMLLFFTYFWSKHFVANQTFQTCTGVKEIATFSIITHYVCSVIWWLLRSLTGLSHIVILPSNGQMNKVLTEHSVGKG